MTQDTKDYDTLSFTDVPQEIYQAALKVSEWCENNGIKKWKINGCASRDWLEELQQPVGVEPVGYVSWSQPNGVAWSVDALGMPEGMGLCSASDVARLQASNAQLQAERDELVGLVKDALENPYREGTKSDQEYKESILRQLAKIEGSKS